MDQFATLKDVLTRMKELGAERFFFKILQDNDNSKQQIYVADSPSSLRFIHPSWRFDAETSTPKASLSFSWVTPSDQASAPHAKLIFYPNYPEVRLSGLLQGSPLSPRTHMRPLSSSERGQGEPRVLLLGITHDGYILGHLALPGTNVAAEAGHLKSDDVFTEVLLSDGNVARKVEALPQSSSSPKSSFGVIVEPPDDESDDDYSDDSLFEISSWGADLSFRELITRYDENELVKPELQRHYVWDKVEASRFIDSILLGLPVPSIFLAKTKDEKLLIIDGYQRLMTVRDFVKGRFTKDDSAFKLSRAEKIHERWRGKAFSDLTPDEQRKIRNTTIHAIIFLQKQTRSGDTSLYQIFERINSSGRTLLPQEIRNCVYQGALNSLLIELNELPMWRDLWGAENLDDRMRDMEFILRFFALSSDEIFDESKSRSRISLKKYLNEFMAIDRSHDIDSFRARFVSAISIVHRRIGLAAFHNISSSGDPKNASFSPTVFDAVMIATDRATKLGKDVDIPGLAERRMAKLRDGDYQSLLYQETMRTENIRSRVNLMQEALYG
jgi:hypothetical protein